MAPLDGVTKIDTVMGGLGGIGFVAGGPTRAGVVGAVRVGVALHLEVHADLEELQRRQLADRLGVRQRLEDIERPLTRASSPPRRRA